jgi:hypothetical protein
VVGNLVVEIFAVHPFVPIELGSCFLEVIVLEVLGCLSSKRREDTDEVLGVLLEQFVVDPRPVVEALGVRTSYELNEVLVARKGFG